ncbi:hypothetical protein SCHPADRAFT_890812 [Schizopora paradoxa]|uniref:Uncharacterized protein n=1 Tax=Schizopora paradoxa TaxID=27342 RepID=A0A0H2S6I6_9AGAM|nr:hypothetical protein SCHPADRAFT_890812 [Schizopora paradoxa]
MSNNNKAFHDAQQVFKAISSLNPQFSMSLMPIQEYTGKFLVTAEITDKNQSSEKDLRLHECSKGNVDGYGWPGKGIYDGFESPYVKAMHILEAHPTFSPCLLLIKRELK